MRQPTRREAVKAGLGGAAALIVGGSATAEAVRQSFHHDRVLGTSLDVWHDGHEENETRVLAEIERLRRVFSTYDPESELNRLNRAETPFPLSHDMKHLLRAYEFRQDQTDNVLNGVTGALTQAWRDAERIGREPSQEWLDELVFRAAGPDWLIDEPTNTVSRFPDAELNLNSIAKGYILDRAAATMRSSNFVVNLGGDIAVKGSALVAVQDPAEGENAKPLALLRLKDCSVATSGSYERGFTVAGVRHSHLIDPRTGRPADGVQSATVIAPNSETANALATACCILSTAESLALIASIPGTACLIVTAAGDIVRDPRFGSFEVALQDKKDEKKEDKKPASAWPEGYQVKVDLELPKIAAGTRYRRPYVAVWFENAEAKSVRTLEVWGNSRKYWKDLSGWWKFAKGDDDLIKAVTKATRGPGKYTVSWDGKDDKGEPVPQGKYTLFVEVHREHGKHLTQSGKIECGAKEAALKLEKNAEAEETVATYGIIKKKKEQ